MLKRIIKRSFSGLHNLTRKQVCIIGSGPAGFYFAQHILKGIPDVSVDMYEKLPVPFGLVRYGVAPDHPEVKNVINTFTKTASSVNFRFIGNVAMGRDVSFNDFCQSYHAVVLAYGCGEDSELNIKGEKFKNVISARCFVGWYNGLPENQILDVDLSTEKVAILGQGNVAIDVARILLTPIDILKKTDITSNALEYLSRSKVKTVYLIGRRGPLQVAFTIKEFREMIKIPGLKTLFRPQHLINIENYVSDLPRPRKRLTELIMKAHQTVQEGDKNFEPLFFLKPIEILDSLTGKVTGVKFIVNDIIDPIEGTVINTDKFEVISCGLVFRSIGYKGTCPDCTLPFDESTKKIRDCGGIYSAGWINTGPVGVILSTMNNAFKQASKLIDDIDSNRLDTKEARPGYEYIRDILKTKGIVTVNFEGWKKIDKVETERGKTVGKPREKIVSIKEMLQIGGSTS